MENGLIDINASQFENLSPSEFSNALTEFKKSEPNVSNHPVVRRAVAHFQTEFFKRKGQMQQSSLDRLSYAWGRFVKWCIDKNLPSLPADPSTVENYLIDNEKLHRNTLDIHVWAVSKTHKISGLPDPTVHEFVKAQRKQIKNRKVRGRETIKQASPFNDQHLDRLFCLWADTDRIQDLRDLMIMSIAYETGLRASNIRNIKIGDYYTLDDGTGRLVIPFTKTNHTGREETKFLSEDTVELIERYLDHEIISEDETHYLVQRFKNSGVKNAAENQSAEKMVGKNFIGNVFARVWRVLDLGGKRLSGHSARVGVSQDLYNKGVTNAQIMHLLGWSTDAMLIRYTSEANAGDSIMAKGRKRRSRRPEGMSSESVAQSGS